ncbi:hypothetical protein Droror1_Dr00012777 [Drosera rotundifolia]
MAVILAPRAVENELVKASALYQDLNLEIRSSIFFAPIGLLDMFNTGGAVEQFDVKVDSTNQSAFFDGEVDSELTTPLSDIRASSATITLRVRGTGRFGAYSSQRPLKCTVDGTDTSFEYESATGLMNLSVPLPEEEMYRWVIDIHV